jgi:hypothetical protein
VRARELEEIVAQHADRAEGDRHEDREHRFLMAALLPLNSILRLTP